MDLTRLRVAVRPHTDDLHRAERPEFSVPYLPDGCPAAEPHWSPIDGVYSPHQGTVCPDCLPRWHRDADISAPYPNLLPPGNPLVILLEPTPTPARGVSLDLATCLDDAGFTRAGWLPLPGLADTFVWDHPTDQTRVILHAFGVEFHLRHPRTGQRFHTHLGRRFSPVRLRHLLAAGGYHPDADSTPHPVLPLEGWALDSDESALLITIAGDPEAARGSLVLDAALVEALRAGWITAVAMPDGSLVFAFRSLR